ncbi:MAG TPA: hypothetical protein VGK02_11600 [Candidatus Aquicultor sp.]
MAMLIAAPKRFEPLHKTLIVPPRVRHDGRHDYELLGKILL